ncbi:Inner membrane ABC transporter permease protein ydcU [Pseudomonas knackmussii B13]|uniref:Inner membrane ABC transporter permease protein ydcU n=1 Tax=Pseudomonas knackmussii (strain DSM 6978 / CCUG 54928 / LMG 23759 / B13) TaxID=1301098 RepID=A0A024HDC4_PSEKB|nr:ABC transporter permease [Pseudomonas knackmussii]CDF82478.1 Inner membrane ABC transporter permease protein ydcU [Pseudomonas knackmussii B13]
MELTLNAERPVAGNGPLRRLSNLLYRKPNLYLSLLLVPPLLWFGAIYLGSLLTLMWQGFYTFDDFTMTVTPDLTWANFANLFNPANFDIIQRTLVMAVAVSIASGVVAFPIAYYMARYTTGKTKAFFYIAVMMPMWASYIVKAYAWTLLLAKGGVAQWFIQHMGLEGLLNLLLGLPGVGGNTLSTSHLGRFLVFVYIWLPFMILPIQASLERLPPSLLQASADLGAHPRQTFFQVILPLSIPGIAAGSIFTFSLTLGDFIVPQLIGPPGYFIGSMVYAQQGAIGNMPMAAAFTLVPIVLIAVYLSIVKRLGAFDAL